MFRRFAGTELLPEVVMVNVEGLELLDELLLVEDLRVCVPQLFNPVHLLLRLVEPLLRPQVMVQIRHVQGHNIRLSLCRLLSVLLAHLGSMILFRGCVVERTDLFLVAFEFLTILSLVAVRMVQFFNGRVRPVTQEALRAMSYIDVFGHVLAVLRHVVEEARRSSEVSHMVRIQAVLRVVRVGPLWAPACFILVHVEREALHFLEELIQVFVECRFIQ